MTDDRVDYDKYLGTTLKGDVDIKLSPMWVDDAIDNKLDIGTIKSANARDVTLTTTYEQRKNILSDRRSLTRLIPKSSKR